MGSSSLEENLNCELQLIVSLPQLVSAGCLVSCCYHSDIVCSSAWKLQPRGCCALPGTRSTVNSSQLPQLPHLVSAECL